MANKQALRDLQLRLASRLQAARETPRAEGWLAVACGGSLLLLPLAQAGEIHTSAPVLPLPHARPWLSGVANLRGDLCAVVDLARYLRLGSPEAPPASGPMVALNASLGLHAALRVDRLVGLRDATQMSPDDDDAPRPAFVGERWCDVHGQRWQALDLARLVSDPLFLDVAERPAAGWPAARA